MTCQKLKFIDIGANLTDGMFSGIYNGKKKHEADIVDVIHRSWDFGLQKIIVTAGSLSDSHSALDLCSKHDNMFTTVGCHPTRCNEFDESPEEYAQGLSNLLQDSQKVVALGEIGLDYDRLGFCSKDAQKKYFDKQLRLFGGNFPLFVHCRNAADDVISILSRYQDVLRSKGGVIHSFDGSLSEAEKFIQLGYFIGINGCSLRTSENLEVVKKIPSDRIMIETDSPWCEIRPSHAGFSHVTSKVAEGMLESVEVVKKERWKTGSIVKNRNEPCFIVQILEAIASIKNENVFDLCDIIYNNTQNLFFGQEQSPK